jgi:hypothetical protein
VMGVAGGFPMLSHPLPLDHEGRWHEGQHTGPRRQAGLRGLPSTSFHTIPRLPLAQAGMRFCWIGCWSTTSLSLPTELIAWPLTF